MDLIAHVCNRCSLVIRIRARVLNSKRKRNYASTYSGKQNESRQTAKARGNVHVFKSLCLLDRLLLKKFKVSKENPCK